MAWTTKKIYIDMNTAEVLDEIQRRGYTIVKTEVILKAINPTHNEKIIIYECRPTGQGELFPGK